MLINIREKSHEIGTKYQNKNAEYPVLGMVDRNIE
jgi:hypothetical protein